MLKCRNWLSMQLQVLMDRGICLLIFFVDFGNGDHSRTFCNRISPRVGSRALNLAVNPVLLVERLA